MVDASLPKCTLQETMALLLQVAAMPPPHQVNSKPVELRLRQDQRNNLDLLLRLLLPVRILNCGRYFRLWIKIVSFYPISPSKIP